jgi:hypothetical protein
MKLLINNTDYIEATNFALNLKGEYNKSVIFHCYWNGILNEKHLYSILSCYYFNIYKNKHKIILWLENNTSNQYNVEIEKYAEIRYFSLNDEKNKTLFMKDFSHNNGNVITLYADYVRTVLLYNYGGVWFDLDCFFLRNFDPIFYNFENEICVYQWENQNYPNNAIYIALEPKSEKMKQNIEFINNRNRGWGFQDASLTYDLPLDMLVLPCTWFDADWLVNGMDKFFKNTDMRYDFNNFYYGCFCYHWHNRCDRKIEDNSIFIQLVKIIEGELKV